MANDTRSSAARQVPDRNEPPAPLVAAEIDVDPLDRDDLYRLLAMYLWGTAAIVVVAGIYAITRYLSNGALTDEERFISIVALVGLLLHPPAFWVLGRLSKAGLRDFGFGMLMMNAFTLTGIIYTFGIYTASVSVFLFSQLGMGTVILDRKRVLILVGTMLGTIYLLICLAKFGVIPHLDFAVAMLDYRKGWLEFFSLISLFTGTVTAVYFWTMYVRIRLENARRELAVLAATDKLTGLPNRRNFDEALTREVLRALRTERPLALLMCDADHFKQVNDAHGHAIGDEVLRRIAAVILGSVRVGVDTPSRFGGEEFAILLPETELKGAREVAQRIADAVRTLRFEHHGRPFGVTLSIGVGVLKGDNLDGDTLVELSDSLLYRAKKGGRDRVIAGELKDLSN